MRDLVNVLRAMTDPMRLRIIKMLEKKRMCVCELTVVLKIKQASVSHHLKTLKDAGLVNNEYNKYAPKLLNVLSSWLNNDSNILVD